jgi:hypothetical protein
MQTGFRIQNKSDLDLTLWDYPGLPQKYQESAHPVTVHGAAQGALKNGVRPRRIDAYAGGRQDLKRVCVYLVDLLNRQESQTWLCLGHFAALH